SRVALANYSSPFPAGDEMPDVVVFLAEQDVPEDPVEAASEQVAALARVAAKAAERGGVLWVVTRDAQQTTARPEPGSLVVGALWSLGRVLHNEMPRLSMHLLDCPASDPPTERARYLAAELAAPTDGDEIVWTPQGRHVLRVRRGLPPRWANES